MDNDLDTLATALYITAQRQLCPWDQRRRTDHPRGHADTARTHQRTPLDRIPTVRFRHLFPRLPKQPDCNKRLRRLGGTIQAVIAHLAAGTGFWAGDVWIVDSIPVECGRSRETVKRPDLAGYAECGYCGSHCRYFWTLRLHLLATLDGLPVGFALTGAKADERDSLLGS